MNKPNKHRFLLYVTISLYLAFGLLTSVLGVIIDKFQAEYHVSLTVAALLPFAFFLAYGLTSVPFGVAMDKYGAKAILLLGTSLMALGSLLCYFSNNYVVVIIVVFLIGIGVTAVQVAGNPFIRELDVPSKYTANLTLVIGIGALGYAFSPILVPAIQSNGFSWKAVYLIFAVINAVILLVLFFSKFPEIKLNEEEKIKASKISSLLRNRIILTYGLGIFMYVGGEVGVSSYIITYMNQVHGLTNIQSFWNEGSFMYSVFPSKTALVVALFWLFQALGRMIISPVMKYVSEKKIFIFHSACTVIALIFAVFGNEVIAFIALIAFALVGYFTCASFTSIFSAAINSFTKNHGTISGILGTAIAGGAVVGWLVGFSGQQLGMRWGMVVNVLAFLYVFGFAVLGKGKLDVKNE